MLLQSKSGRGIRVKKNPQKLLAGVGIDFISKKRIKKFLIENKGKIKSQLFNKSEKLSLKVSPRNIAKIFAAKEAFFKASGKAWMGTEEFREMKIDWHRREEFKIRWEDKSKVLEGEGSFFEEYDFIGAQVLIWR